jgi:predicted phosphodiesterase
MGKAGMKICAGDGTEQLGFFEMISTPLFYFAQADDKIKLCNSAYKFNVATYSPVIDPQWIYTYSYAPDQSWTKYRNDLTGESYRQDDYIFRDNCYFRISIRKVSGELFDDFENINEIIFFEKKSSEPHPKKKWIADEAERVAKKINELHTPNSLVFAVLSDTHYVVNGTWNDTAEALRQLQKKVNYDGIIHLGDFTDGMVTGDVTKIYANIILNDLKNLGAPCWAALGNHDSNYFKDNPDIFTIEEQCEFYLQQKKPHYNIDFDPKKLRLLFLDSFDVKQDFRYGYSSECINWLGQTLEKTPDDWRVIIFSHLPPVTRLQFWAKELRGEEEIRHLLHTHSKKILVWINGHNHADRIDHVESVPIVSAINAKCEAFTEYKPQNYITPERKLDTATQEAWDILIVNPQEGRINFVRFGAGSDRKICDRKAEWQ